MNLETDLKIEQILISLTEENISDITNFLLTQLKDMNDLVNKSILDKYLFLYKNVGGVPSLQLLMGEFPQLKFETLQPINDEQLLEYSRLFISRLRDKYTSNRLIELAEKVRKEGITEEVSEYMNNFSKSEVIKSSYEDAFDKFEEFYKNTEKELGMKLLVDDFDKKTGGIHAGQLVTILGFAGSFKTTYAANIAFSAMKDGFNVLYLSLEVPRNDMTANFLARQSYEVGFKPLDVDDIRKKLLDEEKAKYLFEEVKPAFQKQEGNIYILDETDLDNYSFFALEEKFREIEQKATEDTGHGLDLVVIDHAQLLKFTGNMSSVGAETSVINMYISFFRQQCINFCHLKKQCSFLVLSQANREGWLYATKHGGMYRLTALADANELERASSIIISVFTDEGLKATNRAKVALIKSRNSETSLEAGEISVVPKHYAFGDITEKTDSMFGGDMRDLFVKDEQVDVSQADYSSLDAGTSVFGLDSALGI